MKRKQRQDYYGYGEIFGHARDLLDFYTDPPEKGGMGWQLVPTYVFAIACAAFEFGGVFFFPKSWSLVLLVLAGLFYGALEKRRGILEGFLDGYSICREEQSLRGDCLRRLRKENGKWTTEEQSHEKGKDQ